MRHLCQQIDPAKQQAPNAKTFTDHRKLLETKELDAVLIATPDHWHATCAIDALNAGKDVYVEKPLTRTIEEGPPIVKAARVNDRICQVGMQQRSGKHYLEAKKEYIDTGKLGKITLARTWWHGNGYHLRRAPASLQTQPSNLDWAHFLGPLKWRDWDPQQYWNWRAYLDFGGGQVTDLFTHWIDVVHMFMGQDIPTSAVAAGGVYAYKDGRTAPDTINVLLDYPADYHRDLRSYACSRYYAARRRNLRHERPALHRPRPLRIPRSRQRAAPQPVVVPSAPVVRRMATRYPGSRQQFPRLRASRKRPNGDVLIGHRSAQASHLGNIAYLEKRRIDFDPVREEILPF